MTYTKPTDPILYSGWGAKITMKASGNIDAGQAVTPVGTMECKLAAQSGTSCIGVAQYDADHGNYTTVLGPGHIVRGIISGTSACAVGDDLVVGGVEGMFANATLNVGAKVGVALETQASNGGTAKILLI